MTKRLQDRVALVFGGGTQGEGIGNGRAAAIVYAREGAKVAAVDIDGASAERTVAMAEGGDIMALQADVSKSAEVEAAIAEAKRRYGRIDILHNNVALAPAIGAFTEISEAAWDNVFAVNVKGMFLACKHTLPLMVAQGGGVITNVSAIASIRYLGPAAAYSASKGAINSLTISIAEEFAKAGIRCNAILPGFMDTPLGLGLYQGDPAAAAEKIRIRNAKLPTGKPGDAWDVAAAAAFLASDEAKYISGVLLPVDGGYVGKGA